MQAINVFKKAVGFSYKLTFAPGATNWNFIAKHNGSFSRAALSNVASYQVNGAAAVFPLPFVQKDSIALSVVPANPAQPCSVELIADDITGGVTNYAASNLNAGNGRYLYTLHHTEQKVLVLDTELLKPANYAGAGVWGTNPVLKEIDLPVLPTYGGPGAKWHSIAYDGGNDTMLLVGNNFETGATKNVGFLAIIYNSGARLHTLYDAKGVTPGGYTEAPVNQTMGVSQYGAKGLFSIDYVNRMAYINFGSRPCRYDLAAFPSTGSLPLYYVPAQGQLTRYFEPVRQQFVGLNSVWDAATSAAFTAFGFGAQAGMYWRGYDYVNDSIIWTDSYHLNKVTFSGAGVATQYNVCGGNSYVQSVLLGGARRLVCFSTRGLKFECMDLNALSFGRETITYASNAAGHTAASDLMAGSAYAQRAYAVGAGGEGVKRIDIVNPLAAGAAQYEGYLTLPYVISYIDSGQLAGR